MNYNKIYEQLINKRKSNPVNEGYKENHHILPKSLGGSNEKSNLVTLTGREHWIAHLLLHKIHRTSQTAHACHMMAMHCNKRGIPKIKNSRMYEWAKLDCLKNWSKNGKKRLGKKNGSYDTIWICNLELKENKKIKKDKDIPDGWIKGRNKWIPNKKHSLKCEICNKQFTSKHHTQKVCSNKCSGILRSKKYSNRKRKWTKQNCKKEALKYTNKTEFSKQSSGAYGSARVNKWLDEICEHMKKYKIYTKKIKHIKKTKDRIYKKWNKDSCYTEAIKYKTRTEFHDNSNGAYTFARRQNWLDEICPHMPVPKNGIKKTVGKSQKSM